MSTTRQRTRIRRYSNPLACVLALALLAGCNPTPNIPETPATPVVAAPTATMLPSPTVPPSKPTEFPPPTIPPITPTALASPSAEAPTSAGYLVYQRPDGSLWRAQETGQPPFGLTEPTEPEALLPWAAAPDGKTIAVVLGTGLW